MYDLTQFWDQIWPLKHHQMAFWIEFFNLCWIIKTQWEYCVFNPMGDLCVFSTHILNRSKFLLMLFKREILDMEVNSTKTTLLDNVNKLLMWELKTNVIFHICTCLTMDVIFDIGLRVVFTLNKLTKAFFWLCMFSIYSI